MQHWADLAPQKPTAVAVLLLNIPAISVVPAKWLPLLILFPPFLGGNCGQAHKEFPVLSLASRQCDTVAALQTGMNTKLVVNISS